MNWLFDRIVETSWQASVLVVLILLTQRIMRRHLSPAWRCSMWLLVFVRLVMPVLPESRFSALGFLSPSHPTPTESPSTSVIYGTVPQITSTAPAGIARHLLAPSRQSPFPSILMPGWVIVSSLLLIRLAIMHLRLARTIRRQCGCTDAAALRVLADCCALLRLTAQPKVVETSLVNVPAVTGLLHPTILMPINAIEQLPPHQIRFILLHELVHVKRRDLLIDLVVAVVRAIHWFNPVLWFAFARYKADRELACDAQVLALTDRNQRDAYGHTLIRIAESLHSPARLTPSVAMVQGGSSLHRRITAIANPVIGGRRWSLLLGLLLTVIAVATCTRPDAPDAAASAPTDPNVRIYNIGDLLSTIPTVSDDEIKTDDQGWPVISPKPATSPSQVRLTAEIAQLIKDTVDPDSWTGRGGSTASIQQRDGQLVIKQSPANHDQIERLLSYLRNDRGVRVVVEARFLAGDTALQQLEQIVGPDHDLEKAKAIFLTDEQSQSLLRAAQAQKDITTLTAPRVTLFNGQRAFVMVASETAYVGDFTEKAGKFEPVIKTVKSGSVFDCQATASADHKYITLTLRPHLSRLIEMSSARWPKAPAGRNDLMIQVPMMDTVSYATTVSVPDGGWLITAWSGGPTVGTAKNPLMMVRARLIEQPQPDPTTNPALIPNHP